MSTAPEPATPPEDPRQARLVSTLGRARGRPGLRMTEGWLFAVGGGLALAGIALVIVGWVGTSRTVLVAGQIPYVVSGGLLGLGLIFLGGFLYFGYWLALLVRAGRERAAEDRNDLAQLRDSLGEITRSLAAVVEVLGSGTGAPAGAAYRAATGGASAPSPVGT